jgi:hypothetical protein
VKVVDSPKRGVGKELRNELVIGSESSKYKKRKRSDVESEDSEHSR